jgi:hypothetical protein
VNVNHCEHCNNDKTWTLYSRRTWFTLFFIPVIPYSSEYLLLCPICNHGVKLDAQKFNELKPVAECNMQLAKNKITQEEHANRIKELGSAPNQGSFTQESDVTGKTETQLNYIKQMKEIEEERKAKKELA